MKVGVYIEVEIRFPPCSNRCSRRLRLYRDRNLVLLLVLLLLLVHQTKYDSRPGSGMSSWFPSKVRNHALVPIDLGNGITFRFPSVLGNSLLIPVKGRESCNESHNSWESSNRISYPPCSHMGAAHIIGMTSSSAEIDSRPDLGMMPGFPSNLGIMCWFPSRVGNHLNFYCYVSHLCRPFWIAN